MRYAYLHGFASSPDSRKGTILRDPLGELGIELELPDLNRPSFAELTITAALEAVTELLDAAPEEPWALVGSSLGGWVAALAAERRPQQIARLVLLCPGLDLVPRWRARVGHDEVEAWRERGALEVKDAWGRPTRLHWGFFEDAQRHPAVPDPRCGTVVLHGLADDIVPIASSRAFVAARPESRRLVELDDDHALLADVDRLVAEVCRALS
jgi:pimeloyl-ACP methyl ester carboxylesterase